MNKTKLQWMVGAGGAVLLSTVAGVLSWSGIASATPALQFNSELLARAFFEEIRINTSPHDRHKHHGKHGKKGWDHDDDDDDPTNLFRVKIKVQDPADVHVLRVRIPPGGHSGWHTHPGPSIVSVKAGVGTLYDGDDPSCTPTSYPAGTGFIDEGGGHVHILRNEGTVELETLVFSIVPAGAERRIDAPAPAFCGF